MRDDPALDRFEIRVGGELAGFAVYERVEGPVPFVHTEIDERFGGRGLASTLIAGALDEMRARGREILPVCPFVRSFVQRHPDYLDLVPAARREAFDLS